ncbi:MAG: hypothetical protein IT368_03205, partial [Candidatus Hydrogenedentes bacterium]|nr:hypothetical protein [Candidatus Hydrogenedentota bacterium]
MRHRHLWLVILSALLIAGCPRTYTFTSADNGNNFRNVDGGFPTDTPTDDGTEGEEEREVVEPDVIRREGS